MSSTPVIKCDSVYKIFGAGAEKMLQNSNGNVDAKTFQDAGCIVGVNNASFEVSKGEMLVVMGLSGSGKSTLLRCIGTTFHIFFGIIRCLAKRAQFFSFYTRSTLQQRSS